ncbi:C-terminal helicase domain-containing protein [Crocosphaera sp. XPORK-15E]|uniref:C-terminal helicase domain-containing protein n=1 Tax=Crocosphaera sp. XPORK-15E TaxID=3110247 RepID=UPI002B2124F8|nr:helicase-related protein [Crocosphaera sp. XPORK-15E]MEA5534417.1 helicase-related protein [Crocosphaera sp. XPORK-15E]
MSKLGEKLGFLFEVGFNIGLLTYIKQNDIKNSFGDLYSQDLQQLKFPRIIKKLADSENINSDSDRKIIQKWVLFFLQKSFLSGLNFFQEYLDAIGVKRDNYKELEIIYYQCYFHGDNSLGTYTDKGETAGYKAVLSQLKNVEHIDQYKERGEFLKADTLMLVKSKNQYNILCLDYSIFSIKEIYELDDVHSIEVLKKILLKEISYLKRKSVFSQLGLDTKNPGINLSDSLATHYTAFITKDKEIVKMIQAGSYAYSFFQFLGYHNLLKDDISLTFNILGYSDRGISSMTLNNSQDNLDILKTCHHIYKNKPQGQQISTARKNILDVIKRKAANSFKDGKNFLYPMLNIPENGITSFVHQEKIDDFYSPISKIPDNIAKQFNLDSNLDLRNAHQELIKRELESDKSYIFLTGNPGIGKTTAITEFLKQERILKEGFLLLYISPRIQVNLDIIEKFSDKESHQLCDDRIFTMTTNSHLISRNKGQITVNYLSNLHPKDKFIRQNIHFINQKSELDLEYLNQSRIYRHSEDILKDQGNNNKGVLRSIAEAINTLISQQESNNIVATVAMQSYQKNHQGDTITNLSRIFSSAYNSRKGEVIDGEMEKIAKRIKHLFFMIDEITGDESGVSFLHGITKIIDKQFNLLNSKYGFNTKIIVADASIVDPDVITNHLSDSSPEPNKIFFRQASNSLPLSLQDFEFKQKPAVIINTNSYPANCLNITYKVFIESLEFDEQIYKEKALKKAIQNQIIEDIQQLLRTYPLEQIIVYIQDKGRLKDLIENIEKSQEFEYQKHYLEIHASLSDSDKKEINKYLNQDTLKVIFTTASASRGLSFPKVKHILVEIPRFEIEKNLMEVIQVIYRGRGNKDIDQQDKQLIFYLAEQAIYDGEEDKENRQLAIQESVLSLINILLILKTSIMTRIMGSGKIGKNDFLMIPIGGKSISAAGETFSSKINSLIKQLRKEHKKYANYQQLEQVYSYLEYILRECEIVLNDSVKSQSQSKSGVSYLDFRSELSDNFLQIITHSFYELLNYFPLESSHISGSLLVVPIIDKKIKERYKIKLEQKPQQLNYQQLIKNLKDLQYSKKLPDNLKSSIKDAIDFIKILSEKPNKTQTLEQHSTYLDQYYAIPLFAFISAEIIEQYFIDNEEESSEHKFRDILSYYIHSLYPVTHTLPIGHQYQEFPFIVFRSYSLNEMRTKLFTDKYFLNSHEINVLSLILSTTDN